MAQRPMLTTSELIKAYSDEELRPLKQLVNTKRSSPKPSDFTSYPGATMSGLRREQLNALRHQVIYINKVIQTCRKMEVPESIIATTLKGIK